MISDIYNFTLEELKEFFINQNIERYRAEQIYQALHKSLKADFTAINNIPKSLKEYLTKNFFIPSIKLIEVQKSRITNTKKFLFELTDSHFPIETVLMQEKGRITICISVQSGCNLDCKFCATGYFGFKKNLTTGEILLQIYEIIRNEKLMPTNIVYMGMGEPFLNYNNFLKSLKILCSEKGLNLSSSKITVSTIGLKRSIVKFAYDITLRENKAIKKIKLALSLHSTDNGIREKLIPVAEKNKLSDIYRELIYFYRKTGTKITYEYIFLKNINNREEDVKRLTKLSRMIPSNINVIKFHPVKNKQIQNLDENSTDDDLKSFISELRRNKVTVNLRPSNGLDINAACGQLAAENFRKINKK